ncbi:MAG: hypothetical protein ACK502_04630 [Alphaproteobacteria bacterium]
MAKKISQLTAATSLTGAELIPVVQSGTTKSATMQQIAGANSNYFFHGFAGAQLTGDPKFYDISGAGNDASFGANLSNTNAWANAGYVSTINPVGGSTDSVIRMPALNLDYNGGEKLIIWWLGKATPEGSAVSLLGDGFNTTYPGVRIRCNTTGTLQIIAHDAVNSSFSSTPSEVPFDGNLHSFAAVLDGQAKKFGIWVDEVYAASLGGAYATFDSGNARDTRTTNTFNIGTSVPAVAASTEGIVCQTRAFVMLKLSASKPMPTIATLTPVFQALRRNPSKRILASVF